MFDNETPYPWRGAFVEWIGFTLLWGFVWMIPWGIIAVWSNNSGAIPLSIGSLVLPLISGYLLFRTVARMITREGDPDKGVTSEGSDSNDDPQTTEEPERVTQEELTSS